MSSAFGPSGWKPGRMNNVGRRKHFPQVGRDGICGRKINMTRNGSDGLCGQSRDGDRHLHYACRVDPFCRVKSWSLEERERHEESHLTNPIWRDASVNVEVHGGNGRYEVRWPTPSGASGAPDFTTHADAIRYAEVVARAIRTNRNVAHETALREDATRTTTIDLVLRDKDGDCWIRVGPDRYALSSDVYRGVKYVQRWVTTRAEIEAEDGAPLAVEHSIKIRGEVVA